MSKIDNKEKKDMDELKLLIDKLKSSDTDVDRRKLEQLKKEVEQRGLNQKVEEVGNKYKGQISSFVRDLTARGDLSNEEKAKLIVEMKKQLTPEQQKQFSSVLSALKGYLKKK